MQNSDMLLSDDQGRVCTQVARFWSKTNTNDGRRMEMESKLVTINYIQDTGSGVSIVCYIDSPLNPRLTLK